MKILLSKFLDNKIKIYFAYFFQNIDDIDNFILEFSNRRANLCGTDTKPLSRLNFAKRRDSKLVRSRAGKLKDLYWKPCDVWYVL